MRAVLECLEMLFDDTKTGGDFAECVREKMERCRREFEECMERHQQ